MWRALQNATLPCKRDGLLFIAIYNDQGDISRRWTVIKRLYNLAPRPAKFVIVIGVGAYFLSKRLIVRAMRFDNPFTRPPQQAARGMSWFHDIVDWAGGYPFEVARPEQIFDFFRARGFNLMRLNTVRNHACNEFVFLRDR